MPYAINLRSRDTSADTIRQWWQRASAFEENPSMAELDYPPHLSLAFYEDATERDVIAAAEAAFSNCTTIQLTFAKFDYFVAPNNLVLWLQPDENPELRSRHRLLYQQQPAPNARRAYAPELWQPHCSVATRIDPAQRAAVEAFVAQTIQPLTVLFDVVDCVSYYPVKIQRELALIEAGTNSV